MDTVNFFGGIQQFEIGLRDLRCKVPIFYYDASANVNMFLANSRKIRKYIKDKRIKIAEILPGITLLGVTCFEYRKTDIGPYNEIGITVPFGSSSLKVLSSFLSGDFEVHVWHLPVTTEIAYVAGVFIYNYPKFVSNIKCSREGFSLSSDGNEIFEVIQSDSKKSIAIRKKKFQFTTYQIKDDVLIKASVDAIGQDISVSFLSSKLKTNPNTQIGKELDDVLISKKSLISMDIKKLNAILYMPKKA